MKESGIYIIRNLVSNKVYIGQSINLKQRIRDHTTKLAKNKHHSKHLQRAYNLDGDSNFEIGIHERCTIDKLDEREIFWITFYQSTNPKFGYNLETGGNIGKTVTDETRKRISEIAKLRGLPEDFHLKGIEARRGKPGHNLGKKASEETILKLRESHLGQTAWNKGKKGHKSSRNDKIILEYDGKKLDLYEWEKEVGIKYATLFSRYKKGWDTKKILTFKYDKESRRQLKG